jgi:hypothetical protein
MSDADGGVGDGEKKSSQRRFLIYQTEDEQPHIEVRLEGETVGLTQQDMALLFQTTKQNISQHLQAAYEEGELSSAATVKKYLIVRIEGSHQVLRELEYYNFDAFLTVNDREIIVHTEKISHELAREFAENEYEKFNRDCIWQANAADGEFEKILKKLLTGKKDGKF